MTSVENPCRNCGVTLNGYSGIRGFGFYSAHREADCIRNLRQRAKKAEEERNALQARVAELEEALLRTGGTLLGAASAYRTFAKRHPEFGKAETDALFSTRVADFERGAEAARAALQGDKL